MLKRLNQIKANNKKIKMGVFCIRGKPDCPTSGKSIDPLIMPSLVKLTWDTLVKDMCSHHFVNPNYYFRIWVLKLSLILLPLMQQYIAEVIFCFWELLKMY